MQQTWAQFLLDYYTNLQPVPLPAGISWLHPQLEPAVKQTMQKFLYKFFNDANQRMLMLGINPGRFGAGITGVNFTAAKQLTHPCGIEHPFGSQTELSAEFIYDMIAAFGGPETFYSEVFIGSVCPLGFVKGGKNLNYYDDKGLLEAVTPFITNSMNQLLSFRVHKHRCVCIGGEQNYRHLNRWNQQHGWFESIEAVAHPRFIMQYRRREKSRFIDSYLKALGH